MHIDAYSGRDVQTFMALLNQVESEGITDLRFVRQILQSRLDEIVMTAKRQNITRKKQQPAEPMMRCPSCGLQNLAILKTIDGLQRIGCRCGYSRVVK